jgi:hypothetical protein
MVSSPGSGKTALLEQTLTLLRPDFRVAALVGDLATENDAARLARSQAPVRQITTGTLCHLEAAMVRTALDGWELNELDFLFIENVGNLVCPSSYDVGEDLRVVLLSVTEGEDKPLKYPTIFNTADLAPSPRWTWPMPLNSTWGWRARTCNEYGPVCRCSKSLRKMAWAWHNGWSFWHPPGKALSHADEVAANASLRRSSTVCRR